MGEDIAAHVHEYTHKVKQTYYCWVCLAKRPKLKYSVQLKNGKIKSYVDKRFCYCPTDKEGHIHVKEQR